MKTDRCYIDLLNEQMNELAVNLPFIWLDCFLTSTRFREQWWWTKPVEIAVIIFAGPQPKRQSILFKLVLQGPTLSQWQLRLRRNEVPVWWHRIQGWQRRWWSRKWSAQVALAVKRIAQHGCRTVKFVIWKIVFRFICGCSLWLYVRKSQTHNLNFPCCLFTPSHLRLNCVWG